MLGFFLRSRSAPKSNGGGGGDDWIDPRLLKAWADEQKKKSEHKIRQRLIINGLLVGPAPAAPVRQAFTLENPLPPVPKVPDIIKYEYKPYKPKEVYKEPSLKEDDELIKLASTENEDDLYSAIFDLLK